MLQNNALSHLVTHAVRQEFHHYDMCATLTRITSVLLALLIILPLLSGCGSIGDTNGGQVSIPGTENGKTHDDTVVDSTIHAASFVVSSKQRITSVLSSTEDLKALTRSNTEFAMDLYRFVSIQNGNLFFSPYGISQVLAMIYAGARGNTESEIVATLHLQIDGGGPQQAFNSLDLMLSQPGEVDEEQAPNYQLNIVKTLWVQKGYSLLPAYLDTLAEYYGAGIWSVDFSGAPEASRSEINRWVSEETSGRIVDLIPPGSIGQLTRMVLTSAIYFNAPWMTPFSEEATRTGPFFLLDGNTVDVSMMKQTGSFGYTEGEDYQAVELLYSNGEVSMTILLPRRHKFESFEQTLDTELLSRITGGIESCEVALTIPKFGIDSSLGLSGLLKDMGMSTAFSDKADFSGITGAPDLHLSDVLHKAYVSVDEFGTEAASATGAVMAITGVSESPVEFKVDRPFIFLIRDVQTGTVLFLGRVLDPSN